MNSIFGAARKPKTCYTKDGAARKPKTCYTKDGAARKPKKSQCSSQTENRCGKHRHIVEFYLHNKRNGVTTLMDFKQTLDSKIADYNLLNHPFYQAWSAGELPVETLRSYAREYGAFISTVPIGWETLDETETAAEEIEHIDLWADFAAGLDTAVAEAQIPQVKALMDTAHELFSESTTALGALYAFEAQQPATAQSKLTGLKAYYQLPKSVEPYFETHSHNEHESEKLLERIGALPSDSHATVVQACEKMSTALWNALTGIHDAECA